MNVTVDFEGRRVSSIPAEAYSAGWPRYTQGDFSVALEDPGNLGREVSVSAPDESKNGLPDLTLRYQSQSGAFAYGASAVLRQLEYYRDSTDNDETAFGWGLSLEARYQLGDVTLRGALTHGDGIGGYLEGSPSRPGYITPVTGELEAIEASGATAGITVKAGPGAATLGYGIARSDIDDAVRRQSGSCDEAAARAGEARV